MTETKLIDSLAGLLPQEICERFKGLKELYNAEHMDYGVYLMALYADNFYKYDLIRHKKKKM